MREKRIGYLHMSAELISERPLDAAAVLDGCVVLKADIAIWAKRMEYVIWHPLLPIVPEGEDLPIYEADMFSDNIVGGVRRICFRNRYTGQRYPQTSDGGAVAPPAIG